MIQLFNDGERMSHTKPTADLFSRSLVLIHLLSGIIYFVVLLPFGRPSGVQLLEDLLTNCACNTSRSSQARLVLSDIDRCVERILAVTSKVWNHRV